MPRHLQTVLALLSMFLLLIYTWFHTSELLAHYTRYWQIGYIAAAGIELAVVGMSLRIGELGWRNPDARWYKWTLALTLVVSALANVAEGYRTVYVRVLTWENVQGIDPIQAFVGMAATGLLSVVVYALADIVGADVSQPAAVVTVNEPIDTAPDAPIPAQPVPMVAIDTPTLSLADLDSISHRLLTVLADAPEGLSKRKAAELAGVNPETARQRIAKLEAAGLVTVNGVVKTANGTH